METLDDMSGFDVKKIGNRIQDARLKKHMSGAELGSYLERNANTVSRIERGETKCDIEKLYIICKCLDVSADYLLFGEDAHGKDVNITKEQMKCIQDLVALFGDN